LTIAHANVNGGEENLVMQH